jgi:hypothetical protein
MHKSIKLSILFSICVVFISCNMSSMNKPSLSFMTVSDTLYKPNDDYKKTILVWKNYYEKCMNEQLFYDAFYLQLQDKVYIGSINSEQELDVNKKIHILDTSNNKNIFDLLAFISSANCSDTISINGHLKNDFYSEVVKAFNATPEYNSLASFIDTVEMRIIIGTMYNNSIRPDSLISLLNRTKDSSLIHFKELLLMPENALLAQTVEVVGFTAEFPLTGKISDQQKKQFEKEVYFHLDNSIGNSSLLILPNNHLRIMINKRYTVLGKFLKLKED